ncbi:MAG: hypothetical protein ACT4QB_21310 [Gammaproteobacteria bacterium]
MFFPILRGQWWLFLGACVSLAIALLHVVVVLIGPDAYRFFGGPGLARQAESGSWQPAVMTLVLAWLFVVFAAYGLSGAGVIRRLPLLAGVLLLIGGLYTFRGAQHRRPDRPVSEHARLTAVAGRRLFAHRPCGRPGLPRRGPPGLGALDRERPLRRVRPARALRRSRPPGELLQPELAVLRSAQSDVERMVRGFLTPAEQRAPLDAPITAPPRPPRGSGVPAGDGVEGEERRCTGNGGATTP